jgi:hypothetical protein
VPIHGANLPRVRDHNQLLVLDAIRTHGASTRRVLATMTGLTFQTIENISRRLIDAGILEDVPPVHGRCRKLGLRPDGAYAVGVDMTLPACELVIPVTLWRGSGTVVPRHPRRGGGAGRTVAWRSHLAGFLYAHLATEIGCAVVSHGQLAPGRGAAAARSPTPPSIAAAGPATADGEAASTPRSPSRRSGGPSPRRSVFLNLPHSRRSRRSRQPTAGFRSASTRSRHTSPLHCCLRCTCSTPRSS